MVARTAETADGKLPLQAVAQAKTSVRTLLGFDPETVKPVNSNSAAAVAASEDEKNQSLVLAAISKMGSTPSAGCAQSSAAERIACVVTGLASSVTVKDGQPALDPARLVQLRDAIQAVEQDKTINRTGKNKVVGVPVLTPAPGPSTPPGSGTPPPPPPTGTAALDATKALFGSLRNNLHALGDGDVFRSTADAIKADLNGAVAPLANDVSGLATLAGSAAQLLDRIRAGEPTFDQVVVSGNQVYNSPVSVPAIGNGEGYCNITQSPLSIYCTVVQNTYLPGSTTNESVNGTRVFSVRQFQLTPKEGSDTGYSYAALLSKFTLEFQDGAIVGTPGAEPISDIYPGEITVVRNGTATQLVVNGRMPGRLNAAGTLDSDYEDWALNVERTLDANGNKLTTFSGQLNAMRAGQRVGMVMIGDDSFVRLAPRDATGKTAVDAANELMVTLRGSVGGTTVDGTLRLADGKMDKSKTLHLPTRMSFAGSLKHQDATVFSGQVALVRSGFENFDASAPLSATNFIADSLDLGGVLSVPARPTLSLTLGATRTGLNVADISAQYRDGSAIINASVSARAGEAHPLVKVSSTDGVAFSFTGTSTPVQVTKDGAVTALLDLSKGMVSYSDGSTESLK
jgi:hypothetical protein